MRGKLRFFRNYSVISPLSFRPGRGGGGSDRGSGRVSCANIRFDPNPIPCEIFPFRKINSFWKHEDLPTHPELQDDVKKLMPSKEPGTMAQRTLPVSTNHWLINIRLPEQLFRYEANILVEKFKARLKFGSKYDSIYWPNYWLIIWLQDDKKPAPPKVEEVKSTRGRGRGGGAGGPPGRSGDAAATPEAPKINKDILKIIMQVLNQRI